jgi:hypothetical protein
MIFRYLIIVVFFIASSCNDKQVKLDDFEIAKVDYHRGKLQRIFVVVRSEKVNDTAFICQVISTLKKSYPIEKNSNISFFSDKKYADYKTELFMDGDDLLPTTEYENWNKSYLGEYEFETNEYKTFPNSSLKNNQKEYKLNGCN